MSRMSGQQAGDVVLSPEQYKECEVGVKVARDDDYAYTRPNSIECDSEGYKFYALRETNDSRTFAAYGVKVEDKHVSIAIAVVDPFAHLNEAHTEKFLELARKVVIDHGGVNQQDMCKYGPRCRKGDKCTFAHYEHERVYFTALLRTMPNVLRDFEPGMCADKPTWSIVVELRFNRLGENGVDWSQEPTVSKLRTMAVQCSHNLQDKHVDTRVGQAADDALCDGTVASNLLLLTRFCEVSAFGAPTQPGGAVPTFAETILGGSEGFEVERLPLLQKRVKAWPALERERSRFLSHRRLLIDTCLDLFNHHATRFVASTNPDAPLAAKHWKLPGDVQRALGTLSDAQGATGLRHHKVAPGAPIPMGNVVKPLPFDLVVLPAKQLANEYIRGDDAHVAKFNAAFREWGSAVNMHLLHAMVSPGGTPLPPQPPSPQQLQYANQLLRRYRHQDQFLVRMLQEYYGLNKVDGALVPTHDQQAVEIGLTGVKVRPTMSSRSTVAVRSDVVL